MLRGEVLKEFFKKPKKARKIEEIAHWKPVPYSYILKKFPQIRVWKRIKAGIREYAIGENPPSPDWRFIDYPPEQAKWQVKKGKEGVFYVRMLINGYQYKHAITRVVLTKPSFSASFSQFS